MYGSSLARCIRFPFRQAGRALQVSLSRRAILYAARFDPDAASSFGAADTAFPTVRLRLPTYLQISR
jgi:hypothetical protein